MTSGIFMSCVTVSNIVSWENTRARIKHTTYSKCFNGRWDILAIYQNVEFLAQLLVLVLFPISNVLGRPPSTSVSMVTSRVYNLATHDVFSDSVYSIPRASSMSDASFLLLAIAAKISASSCSLFSPTVFFASIILAVRKSPKKRNEPHLLQPSWSEPLGLLQAGFYHSWLSLDEFPPLRPRPFLCPEEPAVPFWPG